MDYSVKIIITYIDPHALKRKFHVKIIGLDFMVKLSFELEPLNLNTVFIQILAATTINFSLAGVRLLISLVPSPLHAYWA